MWYELTLTPDDNGTWMVTAPQFEEVVSFGDTQEQACRNGLNAIEEAIAARIANGDDIPFPLKDTPGKGRFVQVPALVFLKSGLYMILKDKGWTRADLMRELGCKREHVDRLFRLDHNSRLDTLEEAFKALGHPLRFDMDFPKAA
ncbi:type II toxin-antitoxin system HicB family antitoxin [Mesorhizobium sp. B2-2-3]|uniref:type II toxin-antitoxin system HicB family antitoxin n=1 Tax=Mesorhizobium sp. B2-2-3 TaxID=2589963 RepID=UPI00112C44E1|nr:type II toxin-antitoxin system HicB family antitoxin [Mesorhizobium sp. B2-2-3]TPM39340.1 type II toxin-antitoxin system HicB family antitoxin [Mesorhizobium sp. B2-2-3]